MTLSQATEVTATFAATFFELLASQQYVQLGRMFLVDSASEENSTFTLVDKSGALSVAYGSEISSALAVSFAALARKQVVVEDVAATTVSAGISGTITFSSELLQGQVIVLLEHCDDETYFVRTLATSVSAVAASAPVEVAATAEVAVPAEVAAVQAPVTVEEPVQAAAEEPVVVSPPAKGKGKGKKVAPKAAAVPEPAPVVVVAEPEVVTVVVDEPVVEAVVEKPAPAPEVAAPVAPAVPTGPKSWATLARKPAGPAAPSAPVVVRPPSAAAVEQPSPAAAPKETVKEAPKEPREPRQPKPEIKDRLMFTIPTEVSDDEIKAALGAISKSIVSLRNQSKNNRVFIDFSVDTAFDALNAAGIVLKEQSLKFQRQHNKAA
jgi:hypothetical protein